MTPMLSTEYANNKNVIGWLYSEKYDGVRAIWSRGKLTTKTGRPILAPAWFTADLPRMTLDGELWMGRGKFRNMLSIIQQHKPDLKSWSQVKFMVFDAPWTGETYRQRDKVLRHILTGCQYAKAVKNYEVKSMASMISHYEEMISLGAEGIVLRHSESAYVPGRSGAMLKLKPRFTIEVEVVGHVCLGSKCVALCCRYGENVFRVGAGMNHDDRTHPPALGDLVTISHAGLYESGKPRDSVFICVRNYE